MSRLKSSLESWAGGNSMIAPAGVVTVSPAEVAARAECVFSCLPHGASAAVMSELKTQLRALLHYHCGVATLRTRQVMIDLQALGPIA